jgi:predicted MFS family arabinose efflux permease
VLADRISRPRLLLLTEGARFASLVLITWLAAMGTPDWRMLAVLSFVLAMGTVGFGVAAPALIAASTPSALVGAANARIEVARACAFAIGPTLAGYLAQGGQIAWAFGVAALFSLLAMGWFSVLHHPAATKPSAAPAAFWVQAREGIAFVAGHQLLRPIMATQLVFNAAWMVLVATFVPFAVGTLQWSAAFTGLAMGWAGIGMVTGALAAGWALRRLPLGRVVGIGPVCGLLSALTITSLAWWPSQALACVGFFLLGSGPMLWTVSTTTLRQKVTPAALMGRVSAVSVLAFGARPVGALLAAVVGSYWGAWPCLALSSALFAVQAVLVLSSPVFALKNA